MKLIEKHIVIESIKEISEDDRGDSFIEEIDDELGMGLEAIQTNLQQKFGEWIKISIKD